jgi:uncharacterized protein YlxW (UPF0749 family)
VGDPVTSALVQFGAVGIIAILLLIAVRALYAKLEKRDADEQQQLRDTLEREQKRGDRLEEELRRLNETVRSDYLTTISRTAQAVADAQSAVAAALAASRRTRS